LSIQCLRCSMPLELAGTREFHEGTRWGFIGNWGELFVHKEAYDVYICPHCGKAEFFVAGLGTAEREASVADVFSQTPNVQPLGEASLSNLLSLKPGVHKLTDLYLQIGYPSAYRHVGAHTALRYATRHPHAPDVALVDRVTGELKLIAIANADAAFTLPDLIAQHGEPEIAGIFAGDEHYFFAAHGLASVATGRTESDILYVQILPADMTLNDYIAVDGYASETFVFASP
jgi:hypothetical protein